MTQDLKCCIIRNSSSHSYMPAYNSSCASCVLSYNSSWSSLVACLPQCWYSLQDPIPPLYWQLLQMEDLALQCRGEWRSHSHLLLLPTNSWALLMRGSCSLLAIGSLALQHFPNKWLPCSPVDVVCANDARYKKWTHHSNNFSLTMRVVCKRKHNVTIEAKAPTHDAKLEINWFQNWILTHN